MRFICSSLSSCLVSGLRCFGWSRPLCRELPILDSHWLVVSMQSGFLHRACSGPHARREGTCSVCSPVDITRSVMATVRQGSGRLTFHPDHGSKIAIPVFYQPGGLGCFRVALPTHDSWLLIADLGTNSGRPSERPGHGPNMQKRRVLPVSANLQTPRGTGRVAEMLNVPARSAATTWRVLPAGNEWTKRKTLTRAAPC